MSGDQHVNICFMRNFNASGKDRMTATLRQIHQAANAFRNRHGIPNKGNDLPGVNDVAVSIVQLARTMMALR